MDAVVARSTFRRQNVQNNSRTTFGSWDVEKCTPLWREAHLQVKKLKALHVRSTFGSWDVEKVHAVVARSTCRSQNVKSTKGFGPLLDVQMSFRVAGARDCAPCQKWAKREGFVAFSTTTTTTPHYTPIQLQLHLHYIPLHYTTPHYTTLHSITFNYTQLQSITLHYTTFHYTTLHYTPLHYTTTTLH